MDLSDTTLGQYHVIEQIGRGGMATVYKASQPALDRYVAVKVLVPDRVETSFIARFEREARAIAKLRHRNILTIFDYGHQGDLFYLVMEYVRGGTLKERLGWPQDLTYAVNIISQVGDALAHAHRQGGMIHRDVKPANVLMVEEDWPLLSDFGLAKMLEESLQLTTSGASIGTPQYMSPEQAQGLSADRRSDIYSLGVVLYEMVTGRPPFGTDSPMAIILRHINESPTPPRALRSDLPEEMERVILKALAKSPDDRYQEMGEFLADLREACPLPARHNVVRQSSGQAIYKKPSASSDLSTPSISPIRPRRRSSPWARLAIGVLLLLALTLTLLIFKDSIALSVPALVDMVAQAPSPSLATGLSATPNPSPTPSPSLAPSPSPTSSPSPIPSPSVAPSPTAAPTATPPQPIEARVWEADGAEMVFVPAGEFTMGSEELGDDERPVHRVYLDDFWVDQYEVTNGRFTRFVAETGYQTDAEKLGWGWVWTGSEWEEVQGADWRHPRGPDSSIEGKVNYPVTLVSWNDADAYCRWAGKRLPNEAQWEKAARGPTSDSEQGRRYAWGDEFDSARANTKEAELDGVTPVGSFSPQGDSPYGASDMMGNVGEWVADWYGDNYYSQAPLINPPGPAAGTHKVLRGGSWLFNEVYARTAFRHNIRPDYTYDFAGFRCSNQ